jgi:uncharacterized membrane protein YbhN (UPF0104 family)
VAVAGIATPLALLAVARFAPIRSPWLDRFRAGCGRPATWFGVLGLTLAGWICVTLGWWASLAVVGVTLTPSASLCVVALVTLGSVVSLVPGGLGVSEILAAGLLTELGFARASAQGGALVLRAYGVIVLLFGVAHLVAGAWRRKPSA